jgi:hypothetical protein
MSDYILSTKYVCVIIRKFDKVLIFIFRIIDYMFPLISKFCLCKQTRKPKAL